MSIKVFQHVQNNFKLAASIIYDLCQKWSIVQPCQYNVTLYLRKKLSIIHCMKVQKSGSKFTSQLGRIEAIQCTSCSKTLGCWCIWLRDRLAIEVQAPQELVQLLLLLNCLRTISLPITNQQLNTSKTLYSPLNSLPLAAQCNDTSIIQQWHFQVAKNSQKSKYERG